jgi:nucleotide-binding universal stress UspA family protein
MTRYLLASASVHTTAAACDALADDVGEGDTVVVFTVTAPDADARDAGDAANVARTRLLPATVESETAVGDPGPAILDAAAAHDADRIVVGPRSGDPGAEAAVGGTARHVLAHADRPVLVVPLEPLA